MNCYKLKNLVKNSLFPEDVKELAQMYNLDTVRQSSRDGRYGSYSEENILELLEALTGRVFVQIKYSTLDFATVDEAVPHLFTRCNLNLSTEDNHFYYTYNIIIRKEEAGGSTWGSRKGDVYVQFTHNTFLEVVRTFFPEAVDHDKNTKILEM